MKAITQEILWQIFKWGIDYGQLLAESERENEQFANAFQGIIFANKTAMPCTEVTREIHSKEWIAAKNKSITDFIDFLISFEKAKPDKLKDLVQTSLF